MSGPLILSSKQLRRVANALDEMTQITATHDISLGGYVGQQIDVDGIVVSVAWDGTSYIINDRIGD
ncbi:hypothetical protein ABZ401_19460 [Streptomyces sp. NPDC005892]|uniref:hypothetical protein n=1 Tax=Streptomyces sp. NPDC005892 TaxID=3155593 RepID=UPI0033F6F4B7